MKIYMKSDMGATAAMKALEAFCQTITGHASPVM
jgi:hypothetical protein